MQTPNPDNSSLNLIIPLPEKCLKHYLPYGSDELLDIAYLNRPYTITNTFVRSWYAHRYDCKWVFTDHQIILVWGPGAEKAIDNYLLFARRATVHSPKKTFTVLQSYCDGFFDTLNRVINTAERLLAKIADWIKTVRDSLLTILANLWMNETAILEELDEEEAINQSITLLPLLSKANGIYPLAHNIVHLITVAVYKLTGNERCLKYLLSGMGHNIGVYDPPTPRLCIVESLTHLAQVPHMMWCNFSPTKLNWVRSWSIYHGRTDSIIRVGWMSTNYSDEKSTNGLIVIGTHVAAFRKPAGNKFLPTRALDDVYPAYSKEHDSIPYYSYKRNGFLYYTYNLFDIDYNTDATLAYRATHLQSYVRGKWEKPTNMENILIEKMFLNPRTVSATEYPYYATQTPKAIVPFYDVLTERKLLVDSDMKFSKATFDGASMNPNYLSVYHETDDGRQAIEVYSARFNVDVTFDPKTRTVTYKHKPPKKPLPVIDQEALALAAKRNEENLKKMAAQLPSVAIDFKPENIQSESASNGDKEKEMLSQPFVSSNIIFEKSITQEDQPKQSSTDEEKCQSEPTEIKNNIEYIDNPLCKTQNKWTKVTPVKTDILSPAIATILSTTKASATKDSDEDLFEFRNNVTTEKFDLTKAINELSIGTTNLFNFVTANSTSQDKLSLHEQKQDDISTVTRSDSSYEEAKPNSTYIPTEIEELKSEMLKTASESLPNNSVGPTPIKEGPLERSCSEYTKIEKTEPAEEKSEPADEKKESYQFVPLNLKWVGDKVVEESNPEEKTSESVSDDTIKSEEKTSSASDSKTGDAPSEQTSEAKPMEDKEEKIPESVEQTNNSHNDTYVSSLGEGVEVPPLATPSQISNLKQEMETVVFPGVKNTASKPIAITRPVAPKVDVTKAPIDEIAGPIPTVINGAYPYHNLKYFNELFLGKCGGLHLVKDEIYYGPDLMYSKVDWLSTVIYWKDMLDVARHHKIKFPMLVLWGRSFHHLGEVANAIHNQYTKCKENMRTRYNNYKQANRELQLPELTGTEADREDAAGTYIVANNVINDEKMNYAKFVSPEFRKDFVSYSELLLSPWYLADATTVRITPYSCIWTPDWKSELSQALKLPMKSITMDQFNLTNLEALAKYHKIRIRTYELAYVSQSSRWYVSDLGVEGEYRVLCFRAGGQITVSRMYQMQLNMSAEIKAGAKHIKYQNFTGNLDEALWNNIASHIKKNFGFVPNVRVNKNGDKQYQFPENVQALKQQLKSAGISIYFDGNRVQETKPETIDIPIKEVKKQGKKQKRALKVAREQKQREDKVKKEEEEKLKQSSVPEAKELTPENKLVIRDFINKDIITVDKDAPLYVRDILENPNNYGRYQTLFDLKLISYETMSPTNVDFANLPVDVTNWEYLLGHCTVASRTNVYPIRCKGRNQSQRMDIYMALYDEYIVKVTFGKTMNTVTQLASPATSKVLTALGISASTNNKCLLNCVVGWINANTSNAWSATQKLIAWIQEEKGLVQKLKNNKLLPITTFNKFFLTNFPNVMLLYGTSDAITCYHAPVPSDKAKIFCLNVTSQHVNLGVINKNKYRAIYNALRRPVTLDDDELDNLLVGSPTYPHIDLDNVPEETNAEILNNPSYHKCLEYVKAIAKTYGYTITRNISLVWANNLTPVCKLYGCEATSCSVPANVYKLAGLQCKQCKDPCNHTEPLTFGEFLDVMFGKGKKGGGRMAKWVDSNKLAMGDLKANGLKAFYLKLMLDGTGIMWSHSLLKKTWAEKTTEFNKTFYLDSFYTIVQKVQLGTKMTPEMVVSFLAIQRQVECYSQQLEMRGAAIAAGKTIATADETHKLLIAMNESMSKNKPPKAQPPTIELPAGWIPINFIPKSTSVNPPSDYLKKLAESRFLDSKRRSKRVTMGWWNSFSRDNYINAIRIVKVSNLRLYDPDRDMRGIYTNVGAASRSSQWLVDIEYERCNGLYVDMCSKFMSNWFTPEGTIKVQGTTISWDYYNDLRLSVQTMNFQSASDVPGVLASLCNKPIAKLNVNDLALINDTQLIAMASVLHNLLCRPLSRLDFRPCLMANIPG